MNENIKTFSLVIITICVFIMTIIDVLTMMEEKKERAAMQAPVTVAPAPVLVPQDETTAADDSALANEPKTVMEFDQKVFDFGSIDEGDVVKHSFTFTNTGTNPLIITGAHGTCGCTIPSFPKEPIMPGKKSAIEVEFNSKGKEGMQHKTVAVTANTTPPQTIINFTANVKPKS